MFELDWRVCSGAILIAAMAATAGMAQTGVTAAPGSTPPATTEAPSGTGAAAAPPGPNWVVKCSGEAAERRCTMIQNLVAAQGEAAGGPAALGEPQQRLLTVLLQPDAQGAETLLLALPHGLYLPAGAEIAVDGKAPQKLLIQTSDQNGAYAGVTITPELLDMLQNGKQLIVSFQSAQQKDVAVPVTLQGFGPGYAEMKASGAP